ncbi:unnamed protein product [Thlaspi arvense]|uniref:Alcohol dehydrogenase-like N-terminal domain-containing protein n=1 Tax=Thlaspi arvense TaxID=13288 RepID=A0AAU9SKZ0_THLAR|nr:unnamed protein product [Thlaspi arvense]
MNRVGVDHCKASALLHILSLHIPRFVVSPSPALSLGCNFNLTLPMAKSPKEQHPVKAVGWAASDTSGVLAPFKFSRRATGEKDVTFKVLYCGICHSDLHQAKNEWGTTNYPVVPGNSFTFPLDAFFANLNLHTDC